MLESLSPAYGNAAIAVVAAALYAAFWTSSRGVRAIDTIIIRTVLGVLLLPFVISGLLGFVRGNLNGTLTERPAAVAPSPAAAQPAPVQPAAQPPAK